MIPKDNPNRPLPDPEFVLLAGAIGAGVAITSTVLYHFANWIAERQTSPKGVERLREQAEEGLERRL